MRAGETTRQACRRRKRERIGKPCEVKGCAKPVSGLSRYCNRHEMAAKRNGAPTQLSIRKFQLRPYLTLVNRFIKANGHHVALLTAESELSVLLADAASVTRGIVREPKQYDWPAKLNLELLRLHSAGVSGQEIFRTVAALWLFSHYNPHALPPNDREFWFAVANAVLNLRERYSARTRNGRNRKRTRRVSPRLLEHLGHDLTVRLHLVLRAMVGAIEQAEQVRAERRKKIAATLEQHPFN